MAAWRLDGKPRTARRFSVYQNCPLPTPEDRPFFLLTYRKPTASKWSRDACSAWARAKPISGSTSSLPALLAALRPSAMPPPASLTALAQRLGVSEADAASAVSSLEEESHRRQARRPLLPMTGRERRIVRPKTLLNRPRLERQEKRPYGKKCSSTPVLILFLSDTYGGRVHDKRIADATPYPLPARSRLLQDLGSLASRPAGGDPHADQEATQRGADTRAATDQPGPPTRRLRIEHVNSSVKRCRIVKDRIRLWKEGVRDLVIELCCALHNFRVRLTPWQPMV